MTVPELITAAWVLTVLPVALSRWHLRNQAAADYLESPRLGDRPGTYELAALFGWSERVVDTAVVALLDRAALAVADEALVPVGGRESSAEVPVERALLRLVRAGRQMSVQDLRTQLAADSSVVAALDRTAQLGLVVDTERARRTNRWGSVTVWTLAVATWFAWVTQGRGVLAFLAAFGGSVAMVALLPEPGFPSRIGKELKAESKKGIAVPSLLDGRGLQGDSAQITAVHGISVARSVSIVPATLRLPQDPKPSEGRSDNGWWSWLLWDSDGDGCGGCGCG